MAQGIKVKHHFVPQAHLERFADDRSQLMVHRFKTDQPRPSNSTDLGHRNHGHKLQLPRTEPNTDLTTEEINEREKEIAVKESNFLEDEMEKIEGPTDAIIKRMATESALEVSAPDRETLAFFIALQWSRSRHLLGLVRKHMTEQLDDDMSVNVDAEAISSSTLRVVLFPLFRAWAFRNDDSVRLKEKWHSIVWSVMGMEWQLIRFAEPALVVSDTLVCLSGVAEGETYDAPKETWLEHGVGVGFQNCARITVPLSPHIGLLLTRKPEGDQLTLWGDRETEKIPAEDFNRYTIYNSREFVAYAPNWPQECPELYDHFEEDFDTQRAVRPAFGAHFR